MSTRIDHSFVRSFAHISYSFFAVVVESERERAKDKGMIFCEFSSRLEKVERRKAGHVRKSRADLFLADFFDQEYEVRFDNLF